MHLVGFIIKKLLRCTVTWTKKYVKFNSLQRSNKYFIEFSQVSWCKSSLIFYIRQWFAASSLITHRLLWGFEWGLYIREMTVNMLASWCCGINYIVISELIKELTAWRNWNWPVEWNNKMGPTPSSTLMNVSPCDPSLLYMLSQLFVELQWLETDVIMGLIKASKESGGWAREEGRSRKKTVFTVSPLCNLILVSIHCVVWLIIITISIQSNTTKYHVCLGNSEITIRSMWQHVSVEFRPSTGLQDWPYVECNATVFKCGNGITFRAVVL